MNPTAWITLTGPDHILTVYGIKLIGLDEATARKVLLTVGYVAVVLVISWTVQALIKALSRGKNAKRWTFWVRQGLRLLTTMLLMIGLLSIWFSDTSRLATFLGLVTAGLAFALQRVVTAFAGYLVILHGNTFTIGDRITMGGVRGDVIKLGFIQTTIMEMGQSPGEQTDDPSMWVHARQYTGRMVTVTNDKVFDNPIYNYTHEFPYIWEEMMIPIAYKDDCRKAEEIILHAAREYTVDIAQMGEDAIRELERRYVIKRSEMEPRVYLRLTDNWVELSLRFICRDYDIRPLKDKMSRLILERLAQAHIGIASSTYDVVGFPPLKIALDAPPPRPKSRRNRPRGHAQS